MRTKTGLIAIAGLLVIVFAASPMWSAPPAAESSAVQEEAKPRGRLPAHFGKLGVSNEQRDQIYSVQADYDRQIDDLLAQIEGLRAQRNTAVEEVLTDSQRARLKELRAEAQRSRTTRDAAQP